MRDKQKAEALARMKLLGIFPETIKQFDRDGKVSISEPPFGAFYWAEGWDLDRIEQFEEDHDALVYLVIRSYTTHGKMDDYLYVSKYEEEWEQDREDLKNGMPLAYTFSFDDPQLSEIGYIVIEKTMAGGLTRTW